MTVALEQREVDLEQEPGPEPLPAALVTREWLVANGLGGYACGTVSGVATRRYHGLLIAALPAPLGRTLMLAQLTEVLRLPDGTIVPLGGESGRTGELRLESGLPVWRYEAHGYVLERRVFLGHLQNTAYVLYRLIEGSGIVRLEMHPTIHFRGHDDPVSKPLAEPFAFHHVRDRYEICGSDPDLPPLRLAIQGANPTFTVAGRRIEGVRYETERRRGYDWTGDLWSPGFFGADLADESEAALIASVESWETMRALPPREALEAELERRRRLAGAARDEVERELVLAADSFVVTPGRAEDAARARAAGDEARSIIAGYHWFTDWGRDTMISLEGLTLTTGRHLEAGCILRTFARHMRDGLIPNLFPEGDREGLYHTADATLWFFHALHRYVEVTGDRVTLELLLPTLLDIVDHHLQGTRFGIGV
ncbi:MAG: glycogen debranching enzyme N-terminal domain-containing protein, partial [Thermoanaerobaculia bacterium]